MFQYAGSEIDILILPLSTLLESVASLVGDRIAVRPTIDLSLLDEITVDEHVQIRIEPAVSDLPPRMCLKFLLHRLARRAIQSSDDVQQITLEPR